VNFELSLSPGRIASCEEIVSQPYANCRFSAGVVSGIPPDTIYLCLGRDGEDPTTFFFRPDEALAILHVLSGALWSNAMSEMDALDEQCGT